MVGLGGGEGEAMQPLQAMHGQIMQNLSGLRDKTKAVLQEQETDLLRAFRARLYDVQMELEAERSKKDDGALEWIERTRTLGKELDWSREEALRLDRTNEHLSKENQRLRNASVAQDDDRQFLLRQLVGMKKENASLRESNSSIKIAAQQQQQPRNIASAPNLNLTPGARFSGSTVELLARPATAAQLFVTQTDTRTTPSNQMGALRSGLNSNTGPSGALTPAQLEMRVRELSLTLTENETRSLDLVGKLRKMVEAERRSLRTLRAAHTRELTSRTELELFLRQCIADVKAQLADSRTRPDLSQPERQRVMELLLSQDRVVTLLYDKTFPKMAAAQETWQAGMFKEDSQLASPMGSNSNFESELIR
mmetsp:Transcript_31609/g.72651  ORF Transcript_31609/g.72651 Transcript_31609/m.72651 type:complete len:366 (-) Transcript_31609:66-1163(-)